MRCLTRPRIVFAVLLLAALGGSRIHAVCPPPGPPICVAAPAVQTGVLGINGSATQGLGGITSVTLPSPSTNVTLIVTPFSPPAASVTFRAVPTNVALAGQGTVQVDSLSGSCTVSLTFRPTRAVGPASNELLCQTDSSDVFRALSSPSSPAGESACSGHLPTCTDVLPGGYAFTGPSRIFTIRSPIAGTTQMELIQGKAFDPFLRMMFSRSTDGGVVYTPLQDVTTSVTPGSTQIRGTGQWSDVKVVSASGGSLRSEWALPALGTWAALLTGLLVLTASSVLLARRQPVLGSTGAQFERLSLPIVPKLSIAFVGTTIAVVLSALAISLLLGGALTRADVFGSLATGAILGYLVQLWRGILGSSSGEE